VLTASGTRTVAVLGDMFELGENEIDLHEEVGIYAKEKGADVIICCGKLSYAMANAAITGQAGLIPPQPMEGVDSLVRKLGDKTIVWYEDRDRLAEVIGSYIKEGDTVLVKASHGMAFEKLVEVLKNL